jgi:hypothetical protein
MGCKEKLGRERGFVRQNSFRGLFKKMERLFCGAKNRLSG